MYDLKGSKKLPSGGFEAKDLTLEAKAKTKDFKTVLEDILEAKNVFEAATSGFINKLFCFHVNFLLLPCKLQNS